MKPKQHVCKCKEQAFPLLTLTQWVDLLLMRKTYDLPIRFVQFSETECLSWYDHSAPIRTRWYYLFRHECPDSKMVLHTLHKKTLNLTSSRKYVQFSKFAKRVRILHLCEELLSSEKFKASMSARTVVVPTENLLLFVFYPHNCWSILRLQLRCLVMLLLLSVCYPTWCSFVLRRFWWWNGAALIHMHLHNKGNQPGKKLLHCDLVIEYSFRKYW